MNPQNNNSKVVIYEVLRVLNKKGLFLKDHYNRMVNSFKTINIEIPVTFEQFKNKVQELINTKVDPTGNIKLTYDISLNKFEALYIPHNYPTTDMYNQGVKVSLLFEERNNPNAKIVNNELRKKAVEMIEKTNSYEVILIDSNGCITEGSKSNIFMIKDNCLLSSPANKVLQGITRTKVIQLADKLGIEFKEVEYNYKNINELDAMFISGTSPKILPIKCVENIQLNVKNELMLKLMLAYDDLINKNE